MARLALRFLRKASLINAALLLVMLLLLQLGLPAFSSTLVEEACAVNIHGTVTDMVTGAPIASAKVSLPAQNVSLETDATGRVPSLSISIPPGTSRVELKIDAPGYRGESATVAVYPGAEINVTSQLVSAGNPSTVIVSREAADLGYDRIAPAFSGTYSALGTSIESLSIQALTPGLPQTIRVKRISLNRVDVVPFNFYVKHVVPSEWYGSWPMESLKAGAMGAKTYAWYWITQGGHYSSDADVVDTTADQVYNPAYSYPATDVAVDSTWNYRMTRGGSIFQSHYCDGTYGPGYYPGYEGWMTQWGTKYWADQGKDWSWILHYYYDPYGPITIDIAASGNHATSDFNGDGKSDALAIYDYGGSTTGLWVFSSTGSTLVPETWWSSAPGGFDPNRAKWVSGDFNGDGYSDLAALYDYGGTTAGIWLFPSTGAGFNSGILSFYSTGWVVSQTKLAAGDFDGDGKDELVAFYGYGGSTTGIFLFDSSGNSLSYPRMVFLTGYWDWSRTTLVAGDFDGNGVTDAGAVYDYGGAATGVWLFPFSLGGNLLGPRSIFYSPSWVCANARYFGADVDKDGRADIVAPYNYGGTATGVWFFKSTGSQLVPSLVYATPYWDYSRSTFLTGDYTGDGLPDALAVYNYAGTSTGVWLFPSNGSTVSAPRMIYSTPYWNNLAARWISQY